MSSANQSNPAPEAEENRLPASANSQTETDESGETNKVSSHDFMRAVFGTVMTDADVDALPVWVSFNGNPSKAPAQAWIGDPWRVDSDPLTNQASDYNNYFSLASFRPEESGRFRRQKTHFATLHAVMLDDAGTKVPMARLTLAPSWVLETSPGNHQVGYLLSEPMTDGPTADRLMKAIIDQGLCDAGSNGPRTRLARLPVGANGKHSPPFVCQLVTWSPELRYSLAELVEGLGLDMASTSRPKRKPDTEAQQRPVDGDPVWLPRPDENSVLLALRERDLYKEPLGNGKHDIRCPWVKEHTDAVDGGTAYFEPDDSWPIGGFKCLHGHCSERNVHHLLKFVGVNISAARMKPTIRVVAGEIHRVVDAAELELAHSGRHFQRGGLITSVVTDPGTRETRVQEISPPSLVRALAGVATWERFDLRSGDWCRTDPPARHATVLFDASTYKHLPVLNGLTRQPYLRPDGSLMLDAGYDSASGMFGVFDEREFSVPPRPTRTEALCALALLRDLLTEFKFAGDTDLAAALAAILTATVRPSLSHAPMFHVRAHMVGSGKSYCCELITAFATPQRGTPTSFPGDDEECRKLLLAELMRGPAVIEFDNLTGDLIPHKSLCTALTSEHVSGRILGVSKTTSVNTRTLFLSSGNNCGPIKDMSRRCITINLDPGCEVPAARTFDRPDLVREVLRQRGLYVSAALTVVRAWIAAGRPKSECKALAGFSDWSDLCREPLLWLGLSDPTQSVFVAMAEDPDRESLGRLLTAWQGAFGKTSAMVRDAVQMATSINGHHVELREILRDIGEERGEINRRKLGWWIKRHAGQIVDGRRFIRGSGNRSAETWRVDSNLSVSEVQPVSNDALTESVSDDAEVF